MAIGSTVFTIQDSHANARAFGRANNQRGPGAFPQVRKVSLAEVGTHAEVAFVLRGIHAAGGEQPAPVIWISDWETPLVL